MIGPPTLDKHTGCQAPWLCCFCVSLFSKSPETLQRAQVSQLQHLPPLPQTANSGAASHLNVFLSTFVSLRSMLLLKQYLCSEQGQLKVLLGTVFFFFQENTAV